MPRIVVSFSVLVLLAAGAFTGWKYFERQARRANREAGYPHRPYFVEKTGAFENDIRESSGVATSRLQAGVFWTHNDSGGDPVVYAMTPDGRRLGDYRVRGARARDWEDLASGPCPADVDAPACLYIADTGDNQRRRDTLHVYVVAEPVIDMQKAEDGVVTVLKDIAFVYPDEPHDSEALGVTPDADLLIVTKGRTGSIEAFRVPTTSGETVTAEHLATFPITPKRSIGRLVSGAAISRDGGTLVVRTYTELYFFDLESGQLPVMSTRFCFLGGLARAGEAIDFFDDSTFVLTGESVRGVPGPIHLIRCH